MLSLIVARARGGAIGQGNTIPWHAPEDLRFFQRETAGAAVIMGRRTWDSLPVKPLKARLNIVVSRGLDVPEGVLVCAGVDAALEAAHAAGHRRVYGIGGAGIYAALLPLAHRLLVTEVALDVPGADTFFPAFSAADWALIGHHDLRGGAPACVVHEYLRRHC